MALAEGGAGWRSLCRLVTAAHAAGERGRPVVTRRMVGEHAEGLVVLLGPWSDVGRAAPRGARRGGAAAGRVARDRRDRDRDRRPPRPGDGHRAARMLGLAREAGVPAVLANAVRYLEPADHPVAQVLDAARRLAPLDRRHLDDRTGHAYLKSVPEMRRVAEASCGPDEADALLAATRRLSERCVLDPRPRPRHGRRPPPGRPRRPVRPARRALRGGTDPARARHVVARRREAGGGTRRDRPQGSGRRTSSPSPTPPR